MIIKTKLKLALQNYMMKRDNPQSYVKLVNCFNPKRISVGKWSYGAIRVVAFNNKSKISIGCLCSIAQDVKFIIDADHSIETLMTYPFKTKIIKTSSFEASSKGDIVLEDDVWVGYGCTILSGVHIGQGAVIAAGSVVVKDVPPYAIVGGVPAKIIKYRFDEEKRNMLLTCDLSLLTDDKIRDNVDMLYKRIKNLDDIIEFKRILSQ